MEFEKDKASETPLDKHYETLLGIRPGLVKELAELHGQDFTDVSVSMQVMPFGDRAVLSAYGYFTDSDLRVMSPEIIELIEAAYSVILKAVGNEDIARVLSLDTDND